MRTPSPLLMMMSLAALIASPLTLAASPKKMSDSELLAELTGADKTSKRVAAAEELGNRRLGAAELGAVCGADPEAEVCDAALDALLAHNATEGWGSVQAILERPAASAEARLRALAILLDKSPSNFADAAPRLVASYRSLPPALGEAVFKAVGDQNLSGLDDAVMFVAIDPSADRAVRLAALGAAEQFNHARLYEAYVQFLKDSDRDIRVHSAEGLANPELPGSVVVPALVDAANNDAEGSVRAASMVSLRQYAHTELLADLLHTRIVEDTHPFAWESSLELLLILADESSLKPLYKVIDEREYLKPDVQKTIVSLIGSMNNLDSLGPVRALEQRVQGSEVAEFCREVQVAMEDEMATWPRPKPASSDFNVWVPGSPDPQIPALQVQLSGTTLTGKGL